MIDLARFVGLTLVVGAGFSDDVSHILLGGVSRSLFRVMGRGLEMCVLED